jgi:hypothetical protein
VSLSAAMIARSALGTFIATDEQLNQQCVSQRSVWRQISGSGSSALDASSSIIVFKQPAFAGGGAPLFDL